MTAGRREFLAEQQKFGKGGLESQLFSYPHPIWFQKRSLQVRATLLLLLVVALMLLLLLVRLLILQLLLFVADFSPWQRHIFHDFPLMVEQVRAMCKLLLLLLLLLLMQHVLLLLY